MEQNFKIVTLIISSNTYPSKRNVEMQKKIFFNQKKSTNDIFWYRQGSKSQLNKKKYNLIGNDLFLDIDDDTLNMGRKTLLAFEWLLDNKEFDYVVRPTPSSYVNYKNLNEYILKNYANKNIVYGGTIQKTNDKYGNEIEFASGSTLVLNKKCVELVVKNQNLWDHDYWDDVGLALLLNQLGIEPTGGERFDVFGNPYKQDIDLNYYQYRCRADNHYGYPRLIEAHVLKYIHLITNNINITKLQKYIYSFFIEFLKFIYIYQFGWKFFLFFRKVLKILLPKKLYLFLKKILNNKIKNFKLKRFKV